MTMPLIVIHLDDNPIDRRLVKTKLSNFTLSTQMKLESFSESSAFLDRIQTTPTPNILLLDIELKYEATTGIQIARECRSKLPKAVIILLSNFHGTKIIQDSLSAGADEYYYKDTISDDFAEKLLNSYHSTLYKRGILTSSLEAPHLPLKQDLPPFVGTTLENIQWSLTKHFQKTQLSSTLIIGQKGTGKNLLSQIIEAYQPKNIPFIRVSCKTIPPDAFSVRLFGSIESHPALPTLTENKGFLEAAHGGWLYLEEVAALPLTSQFELLKVLETQKLRKAGSTHPQNCSFKLLCSTELDLKDLVTKNLFLKDLYKQCTLSEITLPPLKNRGNEILDLIEFRCQTLDEGPYTIDQPAIELLLQHDWGAANIDELFQIIDTMKLQTLSKNLTVLALPRSFLSLIQSKIDTTPPAEEDSLTETFDHFNTVSYLEPITIKRLPNGKMTYQNYCELLLLELIRVLMKEHSKNNESFNLFFLEKKLKLSRQTIASKIKKLYSKKLITKREFNQLIRQRAITSIIK